MLISFQSFDCKMYFLFCIISLSAKNHFVEREYEKWKERKKETSWKTKNKSFLQCKRVRMMKGDFSSRVHKRTFRGIFLNSIIVWAKNLNFTIGMAIAMLVLSQTTNIIFLRRLNMHFFFSSIVFFTLRFLLVYFCDRL